MSCTLSHGKWNNDISTPHGRTYYMYMNGYIWCYTHNMYIPRRPAEHGTWQCIVTAILHAGVYHKTVRSTPITPTSVKTCGPSIRVLTSIPQLSIHFRTECVAAVLVLLYQVYDINIWVHCGDGVAERWNICPPSFGAGKAKPTESTDDEKID